MAVAYLALFFFSGFGLWLQYYAFKTLIQCSVPSIDSNDELLVRYQSRDRRRNLTSELRELGFVLTLLKLHQYAAAGSDP